MKKRPWSLVVYAILMAGVAIGFPLQLLGLQDFSNFSIGLVWQHLSDLNILTIAFCLLAAKYAYEASSSVLAVAPVTVFIMGINNWWVGHVALDYSLLQTMLGTGGFMLVNILLLHKDSLIVLNRQNLRWWRTANRREMNFPVAIMPWVGDSLIADSVNLSKSGILVRSNRLSGLRIGDRVQLKLKVDSSYDVRCTAKIVRFSNVPKDTASIAFQFEELNYKDKRYLEEVLDRTQGQHSLAA